MQAACGCSIARLSNKSRTAAPVRSHENRRAASTAASKKGRPEEIVRNDLSDLAEKARRVRVTL
jgi:hypothetical protein